MAGRLSVWLNSSARWEVTDRSCSTDTPCTAGVCRISSTAAWRSRCYTPRTKTTASGSDSPTRPALSRASIIPTSSPYTTPPATTWHPGSDFGASWSRDGKWIYFASDRRGAFAVYRVPFQAGEDGGGGGARAELVLERTLNHARLAPDGRFLYYTRQYTNSPLCRVPVANGRADGEKEECLVPSVMRHNFAVAMDGVYFVPGDSGEGPGRVDFYRFRDRTTREAARLGRPARLGLALSCNEKELLFSRADRFDSNVFLVEPFE